MEHHWILLVVSAAFLNALWTAQTKKVLGDLPPYVFTFFFRGLSALFLLPAFAVDIHFHPEHLTPLLIFWLATSVFGCLEVFRITMQSVGVREDFYGTFSVYNTSPLFTLLVAPVVLAEKVNLLLILGVVSIVLGAMLFYRLSRRISLIGLSCAICSGVAAVVSKIAIGASSAYVFCFFGYLLGTSFMPFVPKRLQQIIETEEKQVHLVKILPIAFYSALATLFYFTAMGMAPVTKVNPLVRTNLIFGFFISVFFLHEKEDLFIKGAGALFILLGSLCVVIA